MHGSDSVPSLRAAPRPAGRAAAGGWLSPWCRSSQGCPTGCCRRDVGLCGVPGSPVPLHPSPPCAGVRCLQPRCQGAVSLVGMREGPWRCRDAAALGRTPLTSPAAGPGWEGSFSGQRRAAAPPPLLGWRWGYPFLTPLHPVNHATVIRGLCGARANPRSHSTCSRYFNFMPLAPGGNFSRSASPGETCVPSSAASSPCPVPEARHHGGEHPASAAAKGLCGPGWRRGT